MISKELLSEVMRKQIGGDEECKDIKIINNVLYFTAFHKHKINIYELAHKCKEWALLDKEYTILSSKGYATARGKVFYADKEVGAIFQACEWILKQKEVEI